MLLLLLVGGITESDGQKMRCRGVRGLYVCLSITFVRPAKTVGQNEMPFSRDTRVAKVIRKHRLQYEKKIWSGNSESKLVLLFTVEPKLRLE